MRSKARWEWQWYARADSNRKFLWVHRSVAQSEAGWRFRWWGVTQAVCTSNLQRHSACFSECLSAARSLPLQSSVVLWELKTMRSRFKGPNVSRNRVYPWLETLHLIYRTDQLLSGFPHSPSSPSVTDTSAHKLTCTPLFPSCFLLALSEHPLPLHNHLIEFLQAGLQTLTIQCWAALRVVQGGGAQLVEAQHLFHLKREKVRLVPTASYEAISYKLWVWKSLSEAGPKGWRMHVSARVMRLNKAHTINCTIL